MGITFNPFTGTFDFTGTGGGGGGTIGGSIAAPQVAFGTGVNTIGGSNQFTFDSTSFHAGLGGSIDQNIGTLAASMALNVRSNSTGTTTGGVLKFYLGEYVAAFQSPTADANGSANLIGLYAYSEIDTAHTWQHQIGVYGFAASFSGATQDDIIGVDSNAYAAAPSVINRSVTGTRGVGQSDKSYAGIMCGYLNYTAGVNDEVWALSTSIAAGGGVYWYGPGTLPIAGGLHLQDIQNSATVTTNYGIKIEDLTGGSTNYAIFTGLGLVHFGGAAIEVASAAAIRGTTLVGQTWVLQAYDTDDAVYRTFATFTNGVTPSLALAFPTGGSLTGNFTTLQVNSVNVLTAAVTSIATTSPITGGPITTTGTIALDVSVDFLFTHSQTITPAAPGFGGLTIAGNTETASNPVLNLTQTWNNAGATFTGIFFNVTNTNSGATSRLLELEVGSASIFTVQKDGQIFTGMLTTNVPGYSFVGDSNTGVAWRSADVMSLVAGGSEQFRVGAGGLVDGLGSTIAASNGGRFALGAAGTNSVFLERDAANTLALRNGTNAQIFNLYNTFTSSTSFERLMLDWATTANVAMIYTQKGSGGGTARVLQLNYGGTTTSALSIPITSGAMTFGADPTISGFGAIIYNTGTVSLTAQAADITDTALTINGTGLYSVTYYILTTTADAAAGTVTLAIKYTDDSGAKEIDSNAVTLTATTGFDAGGPITVRSNSGTVTYGTTHTGSYGTAQYALYITIEKLN